MNERVCRECGNDCSGSRTYSLYCSKTCEQTFKQKQKLNESFCQTENVPTGTIGAISELRVCSELLSLGYHVYRSQSQAAPCDLVIFRGTNAPVKIEVTTGHEKNGKIFHSKTAKDQPKYDHLAIVLKHRIVYEPPL